MEHVLHKINIAPELHNIHDRYLVDCDGNIFTSKRNGQLREMVRSINKCGYLQISLKLKDGSLKTYLVHRIVALSFKQRPKGMNVVNHINGIKTDPRAVNLEWCNSKHNMKHAYESGLLKCQKGSNNDFAKIDESIAESVCQLIVRYYNNNEISKKLDISIEIIRTIREKRAWVNISSGYTLYMVKALRTNDIDNSIRGDIVEKLKLGFNKYEISNMLNIGKRAIEVVKKEL